MADSPRLTGKQQRDSIADAVNNPKTPGIDPAILAKLKAALGGSAPAAPQVDPSTAEFQAGAGPDKIAAMQAANLTQAQRDPAMAMRMQAMQSAAQAYKQKQIDAQLGKLNSLPQNPAGTPTPAAQPAPIPLTDEEKQAQGLGSTYSARE